jgi:hypothetical protein
MRIVKLLFVVAFALGTCAVSSRSQTSTSAAVLGTVRDASNAVVSGAEVTLRNGATNTTAVQTTNVEGYYTFTRAEPGDYTITVKLSGFQTATITQLTFDVDKSYTVDVQLKVGSPATSVTVTAEAAIELQTTNATIGDVIGGQELVNLPTLSRSALELLTLQAGSTPLSGEGDNSGENGGSVAGARSDQNGTMLDGVDISDIFSPGQPTGGTVVPINVDAVDEFRVGVSNPNGTLANGSGSGGQVSVISKGGANALHGTVYWYLQNTALNANTWENNQTYVNGKPTPRSIVHDNRGGFALGGPIKKDKTFFFMNYEPRRFITPYGGNASQELNLPSADLRNGIIHWKDTTGKAQVSCLMNSAQYSANPAAAQTACAGSNAAVTSAGAYISQNCGFTTDAMGNPVSPSNSTCDPRGLGMSPTVAALWNAMKVLPTDASHADALGCGTSVTCENIAGYLYNQSAPIQDDAFNVRLDHNFTQNVHFFGRYSWYRHIITPSATPGQLDLSASSLHFLDTGAVRGDDATGAVDWAIRSNLVNSFRFGWVRQRIDNNTLNQAAMAAKLQLPGAKDSTGTLTDFEVGNSQGNSETESLAQTIIPPANNGYQYGKHIELTDNLNWIKGSHTFIFGGDVRWEPTYNNQDINQGGVSSPRVFSDYVGSTIYGPGADNGQNQQHIYESMLGLVEQSSYYQQLDSTTFQPLPTHHIEEFNTKSHDLYFFMQDTWRIKPSLTLNYALAWGVQTPFQEAKGRGVVLVPVDPTTMATNGPPIDPLQTLATIKSEALQGINWYATHAYGFVPYGKLGMSGMWKTDYTDWQPRVSIAWSPSADSGLLGKLMGNSKTVVRAGYALVYDRYSGATIGHIIGQPGFNVIPSTVVGPACNGTGFGTPASQVTGYQACTTPGPGVDPAVSVFRAGFDGITGTSGPTLPVVQASVVQPPGTPAPTAANPYVPGVGGGGNAIFTYDPNFKMGQNHMIDFSIQRELPGNIILEIGYIGRLGRRLPVVYPINADPYMFTVGGQSFAQAYDCVAQTLRYGAMANWNGAPNLNGINCQNSSGNLLAQPFFETYLPGYLASNSGTAMSPGPCFGMTSNTQCIASNKRRAFVQGNIGGPFGVFGEMAGANCPASGTLAQFQACSLFNQQVTDMQVRTSHDFSNYHALSVTLRNRGWRGLTYDMNYTFSKSLDQGGRTQGFTNGPDDPFNINAMYGPSYFDRTHVFNAVFNYNLPFGQGHKLSSSAFGVNKILGGWSMAGIFRANSGLPLVVAENGFAYGGGLIVSNNVDMIPTGHNYSTGLYKNSTGTAVPASCATYANAMGGDTQIGANASTVGYNYFSDPAAAFCSFRPILLTVDTRDGRGHPLRGFGHWNLDASFGKETALTERFKLKFSADFFNIFNHVSFDDPLSPPLSPTDFIDGTNSPQFGVVSSSFTPAQRPVGSRWIQLGLRVQF